MPERTVAPAAQTYAQLKHLVEETLLAGQRRVEQAKVRTYWETGRQISDHLMVHRDRAEYGTQVIPRLSNDLRLPRTTLYNCVKFFRYFPIVRARGQLLWGHYRLLCQVDDAATRKELATAAEKLDWTTHDVEPRVRQFNLAIPAGSGPAATGSNGATTAARRTLTPKRGTPGLHLVVSRGDKLVADLGFKFLSPASPRVGFQGR